MNYLDAAGISARLAVIQRVIRRHALAGHRTVIVIVGTRIVAVRDDNHMIEWLLNQGRVVGTFPGPMDLAAEVGKIYGKGIQEQMAVPIGRRRGESHPKAILSSGTVEFIREAHAGGAGYKRIASMSGATAENVRKVCKRRSWNRIA